MIKVVNKTKFIKASLVFISCSLMSIQIIVWFIMYIKIMMNQMPF